MPERVLERDNEEMMENAVSCNICYEIYNDDDLQPRVLNCLHTYCEQCLRKLLVGGVIQCQCPANLSPTPSSALSHQPTLRRSERLHPADVGARR